MAPANNALGTAENNDLQSVEERKALHFQRHKLPQNITKPKSFSIHYIR